MMKWSIFLIRVFHKSDVLLFNTKNSSVLILDEKEYKSVNDAIENGTKISDSFNELIENSFLVNKESDEKKRVSKGAKQVFEREQAFYSTYPSYYSV